MNLWVDETPSGLLLRGPGTGRGLPLPAPLTAAELFSRTARVGRMSNARLEPVPLEWWVDGASSFTSVESAHAGLAEGPTVTAVTSLIESDPMLRFHLAIAAEASQRPQPLHLEFPRGTSSIGLELLLQNLSLLKTLSVGNGDSRAQSTELSAAIDRLIRPLIRAYRALLENHGVIVMPEGLKTLGFEVSPHLRGTGRWVLSGSGLRVDVALGARDLMGVVSDGEQDLGASLRELRGLVGRLARALAKCGLDNGTWMLPEVASEVEAAVKEELRFLTPEVAQRLDFSHPLRSWIHSVSDSQQEVLSGILDDVAHQSLARRKGEKIERPKVMLDVDWTSFEHEQRSRLALAQAGHPRPGAPDGIVELLEPDRLKLYPNYAPSSWRRFLKRTGLPDRYPAVDWEAVRLDYRQGYIEPTDRAYLDGPAPGLPEFARLLWHEGGEPIFNTGRKARYRPHTAAVLGRGGLSGAELFTAPEDWGPITSGDVFKNRNALRVAARGDNVRAVVDDMASGRAAVRHAFPDARYVAMAQKNAVGELDTGERPADQVPVISSFEMRPRSRWTAEGGFAPRTSGAPSLATLSLQSLRPNPLARDHAVHLDHAATARLIGTLVGNADADVESLVREAKQRNEGTLEAIHWLITRRAFFAGPRSRFTLETARELMDPFLRKREAIPMSMIGFPNKVEAGGMKAPGPLPDLAELAALARFVQLQHAIKEIYEPGIRVRLFGDGYRYFSPGPEALLRAYERKLREYIAALGASGFISIEDYLGAAKAQGVNLERRRELRAKVREEYAEAFEGLDLSQGPMAVLDEADRRDPYGRFKDMFRSLVYTVRDPANGGRWYRLRRSRDIYANLYNLKDPNVPTEVLEGRMAILQRAWEAALSYVSAIQADAELRTSAHLVPGAVKLNVRSAPGEVGFHLLGQETVMPWHGTGTVNTKGKVVTDFHASLLDQGFVPVFSPVLDGQPWTYVPVTEVDVGSDGPKLRPSFLNRISLRMN